MYSSTQERPIAIFSGRSNLPLGERIAEEFGQALGHVTLKDFSDGEIYVRYEESIRGTDLFIIQSTHPRGDHLMELLLMVDAARRASADRITAVIPYFGYARQERKDQPRVAIAAKMIANMLTTVGIDRVLAMDLHAPQIQGFFDVPVDHLFGSAVFVEYLLATGIRDITVVAPDVGSLKVARAYAKRLGTDLAVIDKRRPRQNEAEVMHIIGEVEGKNVFLIDDIIDTAGTLCGAANALRERGAREIVAACTHAVLSGSAYEKIERSAISKLVVTDTIPIREGSSKIEVVSVAGLFADAIRRISTDHSISTLFVP
jgi:ribose-phosphate pyrophosphokinase